MTTTSHRRVRPSHRKPDVQILLDVRQQHIMDSLDDFVHEVVYDTLACLLDRLEERTLGVYTVTREDIHEIARQQGVML